MRRIAIDFGTTGIRRAILDNGDVTVGESHGIDAFAQLDRWLRDADGDFTMTGTANGMSVTCTGNATTTTITQSCTGDCDVVMTK